MLQWFHSGLRLEKCRSASRLVRVRKPTERNKPHLSLIERSDGAPSFRGAALKFVPEVDSSCLHRQSIFLNPFENRPNIPMLNDHGVAKRLGICWKVLFDPRLSGLTEGKKQEERTVILAAEIGSIFRR